MELQEILAYRKFGSEIYIEIKIKNGGMKPGDKDWLEYKCEGEKKIQNPMFINDSCNKIFVKVVRKESVKKESVNEIKLPGNKWCWLRGKFEYDPGIKKFAFVTWQYYPSPVKDLRQRVEFDYSSMTDGFITENISKQIDNHCDNIILTGAPGTGKTYAALDYVKKYYRNIYRIADTIDNIIDFTDNEGIPFEFVQFHASYDYSDFIEGIKPSGANKVTTENNIPNDGNTDGFELRPGIFKEFCKKVRDFNKPEILCFFIIDEINRADLSSVFGELMFALENRGEKGKVRTQYSYLSDGDDGWFYVPENVVIIGTMNDIDRSVESFDFALRRRFQWINVEAEDTFDDIWDGYYGESSEQEGSPKSIVYGKWHSMNEEIEKHPRYGKQYQIGASYLIDNKFKDIIQKKKFKITEKPGKNTDELNDYLKRVWYFKVESLLREYLRGQKDTTLITQCKDAFVNGKADKTANG